MNTDNIPRMQMQELASSQAGKLVSKQVHKYASMQVS